MDGAEFTVKEAALRCGVSDDTIYRRLKAGRFPNARTDGGVWRIPTADLVRSGLVPTGEAVTEPQSATPKRVQEQLLELRDALARALARAHAAEALAEARADHIADLRALLGHTEQLALFDRSVRS